MSDADSGTKTVVTNRKARHEYRIEDTIEAGIVLTGTEVKSLRAGRANLQDAYATVQDGQMILLQCHISPYEFGNRQNHDPLRPRTLLLKRREIDRWEREVRRGGATIIPLKLYFRKGFAKVLLGLAKGKKQYDKRADIAERETRRRLDRVHRAGSDE